MDALTTAVIAVIVTALVSPLVIRLLHRFSIIDRSEDRSSHQGEVLRGGGLAVLLGAAIAVAVGLAVSGGIGDPLLVALGATVCFALLGFVDDLHTLPALARLATQLVLAGGFAALMIGAGVHPALAVSGAVGVVVFVNAFNFMDGINGISGVIGAAVGLGLAVTALRWGDTELAIAAAAIGGASLGFLPVNFPNAKVFLGDVGSYAIGAALAAVAVLLLDSGTPVLPTLLPFTIYLADVFFTLFRRWRNGANVLKSHREHVYQRLANGGLGHVKTTALVGAATLTVVGLGQAAGDQPAALEATTTVAASALTIVYLASPRCLVDCDAATDTTLEVGAFVSEDLEQTAEVRSHAFGN